MEKHVEKEHPEKECPTEGILSKAEKGILQKKQARVANALSVKDLAWRGKPGRNVTFPP